MQVTVYNVEGVAEGKSYIAGLDHFELGSAASTSAASILDTPHLTLYALDNVQGCAVFVQTPPGVDLASAPFYYLAQKEQAQRIFTVPYRTFNALAETLPDPAQLMLLYSVGRCGSTLLGKALGQLGANVLSEPDAYTHIAGMRRPDGTRDAELTELLRSATRFHCRAAPDEPWLLKFRSQCLETADLLWQAFPAAQALFLVREFEGWLRSMARLVKLGDPEREARFQEQLSLGQMTMFTYPRERYISLLRADVAPPQSRLEDVALHWVSLVKRYLELHEKGAIQSSLSYADLTESPEATLRAVAQMCGFSSPDLEAALKVFRYDAQAGTHLSGDYLRTSETHELTPEDILAAEKLALRYNLDPDIAVQLSRRR